jgi:hypothetical protein
MSIRKEACWTISNITAGIPSQVQSSFKSSLSNAAWHYNI